MKYAFDSAAVAEPKPPLRAVLDKLSQSLKRQPAARIQAAPPAGPASVGRLTAIRNALGEKGVASWRVAAAGAAPADQLWLRLIPPPAGLKRLDDASLGPAAAGRVMPPRGGSAAAP